MIDAKKNKGFTIGELLVVFAVVTVVGILLLPFIRHVSVRTDKILCANNLRELGRALYIYAREHDKKFPRTLKTLYDDQYLADERFVDCPASKKVGTLEDPDYIYTAGLTVESSSLEQLVRDKAKNHSGRGINAMYVNGRVMWK